MTTRSTNELIACQKIEIDESLRSSNDIDYATTASRSKLHRTSNQREEGVVFATANPSTGVEVGAALTHDDFARANNLTSKTLHAKALRIGITTVTSAGYTLFTCHVGASLPRGDASDTNLRQIMTVAHAATVAGLALVVHNLDFWSAQVFNDFRGDRDTHQISGCGLERVTINEHDSGQVKG
jgi:hypothetical protein